MSSERLSAQQDRTWSLLVGVMLWLPAELDSYLQRAAGLSLVELGVLRCLAAGADGDLHMSRLAANASVTPSHLTRIVSRLEKRALVHRAPDPVDARRSLASLSESGARLLAEVEPGYLREVRRHVFDVLDDPQIAQLETLVDALLAPRRREFAKDRSVDPVR